MKTIITCEHASADIPVKYQKYFSSASAQKALKTHQGYDIGAKEVAEILAEKADFFIAGSASRLLIDLNRSLHHRQVFSEWSGLLSNDERQKIIDSVYIPYRTAVVNQITEWLKEGEEVRHISIHSFTPELDGVVRTAEIGILYDSRREAERQLAKAWQVKLKKALPEWRVKCNYPYHGKADGFTTYLRRNFPAKYIGIEIEINQQLFLDVSSEKIAHYLENII